jgi:2,3-bisphosphoglycerate-dependent phosphoglycerate mutase
MARLYLIRHAQSANNAIWDGSDHMAGRAPDPEITEIGHRQAHTLAEHMSHPHAEVRQHPFIPAEEFHFGLTHVYCSLMTRSILTAEYIANACGLELQAPAGITSHSDFHDLSYRRSLTTMAGGIDQSRTSLRLSRV